MKKFRVALALMFTLGAHSAISSAGTPLSVPGEPGGSRWSARAAIARPFIFAERLLSPFSGHTSLGVAWRPTSEKGGARATVAFANYYEITLNQLIERNLGLIPGALDSTQFYAPAISGNGQYASFLADAAQLTGAASASPALFRLGLSTHALDLVSAAPAPGGAIKPIVGRARRPSTSFNGRRLAFQITAGATSNVYLRDMTELAARPLCAPEMRCENPALSADGQRVAFVTRARLSPDDHDALPDVYVTPVTTFAPELLSIRNTTNGDSARAFSDITDEPLAISADGKSVAFTAGESVWLSHAGRLVSMSVLLGETGAHFSCRQPAMDIGRNLAFVAREGTGKPQRLYVYSLLTGKVEHPRDASQEIANPLVDVYAPAFDLAGDTLFLVYCDRTQKNLPPCVTARLEGWTGHPNDPPPTAANVGFGR